MNSFNWQTHDNESLPQLPHGHGLHSVGRSGSVCRADFPPGRAPGAGRHATPVRLWHSGRRVCCDRPAVRPDRGGLRRRDATKRRRTDGRRDPLVAGDDCRADRALPRQGRAEISDLASELGRVERPRIVPFFRWRLRPLPGLSVHALQFAARQTGPDGQGVRTTGGVAPESGRDEEHGRFAIAHSESSR